MPDTSRSTLSRTLSVAMTIAVIVAAAWYLFFKDSSSEIHELLPENVELTMEKVKYTSTKHGKELWKLKAEWASKSLSDGSTTAGNIHATLNSPDGSVTVLTARRGSLSPDHRKVTVWGDVEVKRDDGGLLHTESLTFDEETGMIESDAEVTFKIGCMRVRGRGMRLYTHMRKVILLSHVEAVIDETEGACS